MKEKEITEKIIGAAYAVYNAMGFGYLESVYEKCMLIELKKAGLTVENQKAITVKYDEEIVGEFIADLVIDDRIIVELKSIRALSNVHEVQLVNYLVSTGKPTGLLVNFGEMQVDVKKKYRDRKAIFED